MLNPTYKIGDRTPIAPNPIAPKPPDATLRPIATNGFKEKTALN